MKLLKTLAAAAMLTIVASAAQAEDVTLGNLTLSKTWTRATPPKAMAGGGFVEITNSGTEADRLIAASSPVAKKVELHEMAINDGVMVMREKEGGIEVPAGETVALKPGGLHIMFMGLNAPLEEGTVVPVKLTFEKAGDVEIKLDVQKMGAKGMTHGGMDHSKMDHGNMKKDGN